LNLELITWNLKRFFAANTVTASCLKRDEKMAVEGIIGIKLGMTQVFAEDGSLVGCTVLQAGP